MNFDREKLTKHRNDPMELINLIEMKDKDFLEYLNSFMCKEENIQIKNKNYDIGIYTVGFSPYPILLSLLVTNPKENAILYYSEQSIEFKSVFTKFAEVFGLKFELVHEMMNGSSDTAEMYNAIEKAIKVNRGKKVAIDITGGKKPTIAAGFLGASLHEKENNIDILYMDFKEYENDNPVYGSEYLTILLNPNDLFNTIERKALRELFSSYQYRGARRLSKDILERLKFISKTYSEYNIDYQIDEIKKIYYFSKLYELRNDFNYERCEIYPNMLTKEEINGLNNLILAKKKIDKISSDMSIYSHDSIKYNIEVTKLIYSEFKDDEFLLYLALERYIGALRYKNIDYQSYILRLTSVIELSGIMMFDGEYTKLNDKIKDLKSKNLRKKLFSLKDERNNSSLIHGFGFLDNPKEQYESAVLEYISIAFNKSRKDLDYIMNKELKFRTFEEVIYD